MNLAVENGKIKNIYIARGSMTAVEYPSVLYDGEGPHPQSSIIDSD